MTYSTQAAWNSQILKVKDYRGKTNVSNLGIQGTYQRLSAAQILIALG